MKIFIFENVQELTHNYHSGGGLVVIAESEEHAKKVIQDHNENNQSWLVENAQVSDKDWLSVITHELKDGSAEPRVFVFPDAGCC